MEATMEFRLRDVMDGYFGHAEAAAAFVSIYKVTQ
jgi:hypothetical protein